MARAMAWWFMGVGAALLMLELLFRLLPVSTSTETAYNTDPLILNYPPYHRWTAATGWDLRNAQTLHAMSRQLEGVGRVWEDAVRDLPYYASLVSTGLAPRQIRSWEDVGSLPVLTREILQRRPGDFVRRSRPPASWMRTAGSTGTPLRLGLHRSIGGRHE